MQDLLLDKSLDLIVALVQGVILAFVAYFIIEHNAKKIKIGRNQARVGIKNFLNKGILPERDRIHLFRKATLIRLCFANGYNFFKDNFIEMEKALNRGASIQILLAKPNSDFVKDIDIIEKRIENNRETVGHGLDEVLEKLSYFYKFPNFQIRHYNTMYRYSIILGTFENSPMKAWFNVFLPPKLAVQSKMFYAEDTQDQDNLVANFDEYFDTVWYDDMLSIDSIEFHNQK